MIGGHAVHGHAIVSADDRIAEADGTMPSALFDPTDWARFQAALDSAVGVVLGRRSHEAHPNTRGRNRVVVSGAAAGLERRADAWWWNPAEVTADEALAKVAPVPGVVAVPGGQRVFDLFLQAGFDRFDLVRVPQVGLPDGVPVFSGISDGSIDAAAVLTRQGLRVTDHEIFDAGSGVTLSVWQRNA